MSRKWLGWTLVLLLLLAGCGKETNESKEYDRYISNGSNYMRMDQFDSAIHSFKMALEIKPGDKKAKTLIKEAKAGIAKRKESEKAAQKADREKALALEEILTPQIYNLNLEESDGKFFMNGITLLMSKDEIIDKWGDPDFSGRPDLDIEFSEGDYEKWNVMSYGDVHLTFYSDVLKYVKITPNDYVFETQWYSRLGSADETNDDGYIYNLDQQYMIFSSYQENKDPVIFWREQNPEPLPVEEEQTVASLVNGMDPTTFVEVFNSHYEEVYQTANNTYREKFGKDFDRITLDTNFKINGNEFSIKMGDEMMLSGILNENGTLDGVGLVTYVRGSMAANEEQSQKDWDNTTQQVLIKMALIRSSDPDFGETDVDDILNEIMDQQYKEFKDSAVVEINGLQIVEQTKQEEHVNLFMIKVE
jgi:hypothetical protein